MTQTLLKRNDSDGAVDLWFERTWTATDNDTNGGMSSILTSFQQFLYGDIYVAGSMGIQVKLQTKTADPFTPGDTDHYQIDLTTPWATWSSGNIATFLSSSVTRLEIDDAQVTGDCTTITFSFSEIRFYVGGVLKKTISGTSQSFSGWSAIHMGVWSDSPVATMNPNPTFGPFDCEAHHSGIGAGYTHECTCSSSTQIKRNGSHVQIDLDQSQNPPANSCGDCDEITLYTVGWNGADTTYITVQARLYDYRQVTDHGLNYCYCNPPPTLVPAQAYFWDLFRKTIAQGCTVGVRGIESSVVGFHFEESSQCNPADPILITSDVTEAHSFCDFLRSGHEAQGTTYCYEVVVAGACPLEDGG
jgi:hypothetical protein